MGGGWPKATPTITVMLGVGLCWPQVVLWVPLVTNGVMLWVVVTKLVVMLGVGLCQPQVALGVPPQHASSGALGALAQTTCGAWVCFGPPPTHQIA